DGPPVGDDGSPDAAASSVDRTPGPDDEPPRLPPEQAAALAAALPNEGEPDLSQLYADVRETPKSDVAESLTASIPERPRGTVAQEKVALAPALAASARRSSPDRTRSPTPLAPQPSDARAAHA